MFQKKDKTTKKPLFEGNFQENMDDFIGKCREKNLAALLKMSIYTDVSFYYNQYRLYMDIDLKGIEGKDENATIIDFGQPFILVKESSYEIDIMRETADAFSRMEKYHENIQGAIEKAGIPVIDKGYFTNETFRNMHRMEKAIAKMEGK